MQSGALKQTITGLAGALALFSIADEAAARQPRLPDAPVISTFDAAQVPKSSGSGGAAYFTQNASAFAQQNIVQGEYPGTKAQIEKLLTSIRANSPSPLPVAVTIASDPLANAKTMDGGQIVVNSGLLEALKDRAERNDALAFVLAHEYTHALFNDPASQEQRAQELGQSGEAISLMARMALTQAGYAAPSANGCGGAGGGPESALAGAVMTGDWVKSELYRVSYGPFSRDMETRADFMATDLLVKAHMNPVAGSRPIEEVYQKYDIGVQSFLKDQLDAVQTTVKGSATQLGNCAPGMLQQAMAGGSVDNFLKGYAAQQVVNLVSNVLNRHADRDKVHLYYSAEDRVEGIRAYGEKFYQGQIADSSADLSAFGGASAGPNPFAGVDVFGAYARERGIYATINDINAFNAKGQFETANRLVGQTSNKKSLSKMPVEYLIAAGNAAKGAGDAKSAVTYYEAAAKKPQALPMTYTQLAGLQISNRQPDKALAALDQGEAKFRDRKPFLATRISAYQAKADYTHIATLMQECAATRDEALIAQCNAAGGSQVPTGATPNSTGQPTPANPFEQFFGNLPNVPH